MKTKISTNFLFVEYGYSLRQHIQIRASRDTSTKLQILVPNLLNSVKRLRLGSVRKKWSSKHTHALRFEFEHP